MGNILQCFSPRPPTLRNSRFPNLGIFDIDILKFTMLNLPNVKPKFLETMDYKLMYLIIPYVFHKFMTQNSKPYITK